MNRKGFTLLELIVVLIVMAALVAIALPQYLGFVERGRASEAIAGISAIRAAEESNFVMRNTYVTCASGGYAAALGVTPAEVNWQYVVTAGATGIANSCIITATRQATLGYVAPAGGAGTVILTMTSGGGATWTGTHPGAPR